MLAICIAALVYTETLYPQWAQQMQMTKVLHEEKTEWQDLIIFENELFGRVLALDGVVQATYADARIYAEMMVHVPCMAHGNVKKVLIIGGGDGSVLQEVLRYQDVERAVVVDLDAAVVSKTLTWMPKICGVAFEDSRADIVIEDASLYVKECGETFDVIICDSTDPQGPGAVLFTDLFYGDCKRCLAPGGIFVNQNGVPFLQREEIALTLKNRSPHFSDVSFYVVSMPTYIGGHMTLGFASDNEGLRHVPLDVLTRRREKVDGEFFYYTPEVHLASFALPAFINRAVLEAR